MEADTMLFEDNISFLVLKVLITCAGTFGMMGSTVKYRFVKEKPVSIIIFGAYVLYIIISTYAIIYFLDYEHFLRVFILTISCPAVLLLHNISDEPFPRLVFTRATHILASLYIAATITLTNTALQGTELSDILMRLLVYLLVILLDFHYVRPVYLDFISKIRKGWGALSLIPCALIILAVVLAFYPEHYTMDKLAKQTKIIRHDTRHMLSTIASLAESGDMQAILDFIGIADKSPDVPETSHYCRDPLLDTTLCSYFKAAEESGILLQTSLAIPDTLPVDSAGLAICFANALRNAIEYCKELPEKERKIVFKCIAKPKLMFEIGSPYQGRIILDRNGLPKSPEGGVGTHIRSIVAFCERHDAFYSFTAENGWFKVTVAL